jgi:hypothetical protein
MGLDPSVEEIIDPEFRYRLAVHREGLWGLTIVSFLNGKKKLIISSQSDLSILVYEHGSEISILVYEHGK